jgi:predicted ATPase/class 3 adenylate cyclase
MAELPTGTLTLVFTDVEGSTRLVDQLGPRFAEALADHDRLLRAAVEEHGGHVVGGRGDGFFLVFERAADAVAAAVQAQRALAAHAWLEGAELRVRIGMHTGEALLGEGDYVGVDVHKAARICMAGHGGQILVSRATKDAMGDAFELLDLGEHRLKDLRDPEWLFQPLLPDLPADFPPLKSLNATNLPAATAPIVGREREVATLASLLSDGTRLVTLTGPGGAGKTRLALEVGAELVGAFPNGVFLVELAPLRDSELVAPAVASVLGVKEEPGRRLAETLAEQVCDRRLLLVVDNLEHVLESASLFANLLASAPDLRLLATSRERLRVAGEHVFPVPPLAVGEATALFVERARAARPGYEPDEPERSEIAGLCARLDGLPLAIELAAARTTILPPRALAERLGRRLELLAARRPDAPERQRTLRAALDWSHGLLTPAEQELLAGLSVFAGSFGLDAAEQVCGADIDTLESLVDKSLLRVEEGPDVMPRFGLLETIREYGAERLEERGQADVRRRQHAEHFLALSTRAAEELRGPDARTWLDALERDLDDIRAALLWSLETGEVELGLRLASALDRFWAAHEHMREGRWWLEQLLERTEAVPPVVRGRGAETASKLALWQGDYERTAELANEGAELFREAGETLRVAYCLGNAGWAYWARGETERAAALYDESLELARAAQDTMATAFALNNLASFVDDEGDHQRSLELREECLKLIRTTGDRMNVAIVVGNLGASALAVEDHERAREALAESLALGRELGDARQVAWALVHQALEAVLAGDVGRTEELVSQSLEEAFAAGDRRVLCWCLEAAAAAAAAGEPERAARLAGAADALREAIHVGPIDRRVLERCRSQVVAALGETAWERLHAEGLALPLGDAVALAGHTASAQPS